MALTDLIGKTQDKINAESYQILDLIYSNGAVLLENALEIVTGRSPPIEVPVPLLGFSYNPEGSIELLKYQWSEYPYLNKQMLTNAAIKQVTRFSISVVDPITQNNPVLVALLKRTTLKMLLEKYTDRGGLFTIKTLWGDIRHCVLETLTGTQGDGMQGTLFTMGFMKPNIDLSGADKQLSSFMATATQGGAAG